MGGQSQVFAVSGHGFSLVFHWTVQAYYSQDPVSVKIIVVQSEFCGFCYDMACVSHYFS